MEEALKTVVKRKFQDIVGSENEKQHFQFGNQDLKSFGKEF